jgi:SRSO17 transposase
VPPEWVAEAADAERRRRCGVPRAVPFTTKPMRGWAMLHAVQQASPRRCRWVACDAACGRDTDLLDRITGVGLWYCAEVPHDTLVWRHRPGTAVPAWSGQGRQPRRTRVRAGAAQPEEVAQLAAALPANRWVWRTIQAGSQGPAVARLARLRVMAVREGVPGPDVWLVLRHHVGTGALTTSRSHAPAQTALAALGRVSGMRWPIETGFEDGTQDLGMGAYEVRRGRGWHHHMTLVTWAQVLLVRLHRSFKTSAGLDLAPGAGAAHRSPAQAGV